MSCGIHVISPPSGSDLLEKYQVWHNFQTSYLMFSEEVQLTICACHTTLLMKINTITVTYFGEHWNDFDANVTEFHQISRINWQDLTAFLSTAHDLCRNSWKQICQPPGKTFSTGIFQKSSIINLYSFLFPLQIFISFTSKLLFKNQIYVHVQHCCFSQSSAFIFFNCTASCQRPLPFFKYCIGFRYCLVCIPTQKVI